jgi:hypothetical protein
MPTKDTAKIVEELLELGAKEIDVVARRVQFEPEAQEAAVKILRGLAQAAKKAKLDFAKTIKGLPKKDRDAALSVLEKSGFVDVANLLIPLLRMGDATDPCFLLHEAAKYCGYVKDAFEISADVASDVPGANVPFDIVAAVFLDAGYFFDLAAQFCDQSAAEKAEKALNDMEAAVIRLEEKIDFIMDLPAGTPIPTVPPNTQPVSLTALSKKIDYIMDLPAGTPIPTVPPGTKPVSLTALEKMLEVAKKFYKFEGSFRPSFKKDKQLIRIGPLATSMLPSPPVPILVTGLIDLSGMQNHDVVTITTKVLEPTPSPQYVIWRVKTFTGPQSSGIKHFQDFADLLEVPGDGVEVLIAQSASSHNFDPAFLLTIPYQFLVETTVLPDFNVS